MIRVKNFSFDYGERQIINNISFQAKPGEVTVLMGRNGAGKTTLMTSIVRSHNQGRGKKISGEITTTGNISYLNQHTEGDLPFTVFETVMIGKVSKPVSYTHLTLPTM